jgi:hypothetical protein
MTVEHRTTRVVEQPTDVVHTRLLEVAEHVKAEMPPVKPSDRVSELLGVTGDVGLEIHDRGPDLIEAATLRGRVRAAVSAHLAPDDGGGTSLTVRLGAEPDGFVGSMMLNMATKAIPNFSREFARIVDEVASSLATELARPDGEWDPSRVLQNVRPPR